MTALGNVLVPALQASLNRRNQSFQAAMQKSNAEFSPNATAAEAAAWEEQARRRQEAHDKLTRRVQKLAGVLEDIETWDRALRKMSQGMDIGMGGNVDSFLEGFLEEVLVRVDPMEEEANT